MCDQDHFDEDLAEYEAARHRHAAHFGVIALGAGIAMALPERRQRGRGDRSRRQRQDARRYRRLVLRASVERYLSRRPAVARHPRAAARVARHGKASGRVRLRGARRQPVLPGEAAPSAGAKSPTQDQDRDSARPGAHCDDAHDRREGVHRLARSAACRWQEAEDRHAGYCMGGPMAIQTAAAVPDRVGAGASFHGGGLVTTEPDSPHTLAPKTRAQFLIAIAENDDARDAERQERAERDLRGGESCRPKSRSTKAHTAGARLTRAFTQPGRGRKGPGRDCWRSTARHSPRQTVGRRGLCASASSAACCVLDVPFSYRSAPSSGSCE